jgi:hypothetical protein
VLLGLGLGVIGVIGGLAAWAGDGLAVNDGPLGPVGGQVCTTAHLAHDRIVAFGFGDSFYNSGSAPATIERVALYRPRGIRLLDAVLLRQYANDSGIGMEDGWPPDLQGTGLKWSTRVQADGSVVAPTKPWKDKGAYQEVLLLELWPTAKVGTAAGASITYTESGRQYRLIPTNSKLAFYVGGDGSCSP